jgi:hypothetical protein
VIDGKACPILEIEHDARTVLFDLADTAGISVREVDE